MMYNAQVAGRPQSHAVNNQNSRHLVHHHKNNGGGRPHSFGNNQQFQQLLSFLLPLISQLLSQLNSNHHNCDAQPLNLSQEDLNRLNTISSANSAFGRGGPPQILRVFDSNNDEQVSAGDKTEVRISDDATQPNSPFRIIEGEITQAVADQFNG